MTKKVLRCPKCKGTKFKVLIKVFAEFDSKKNKFSNFEEMIDCKDKSYFCPDCEKSFYEDELENECN